MPTLQEAFFSLKDSLLPLYGEGESIAIAHELLGHITGLTRLQRLTEKDLLLTTAQEKQFVTAHKKLLQGQPLQYVTGVQWFLGNPFHVNKDVLIPRPETEELVLWIAEEWKDMPGCKILDIGTGSGCIPVSLKLRIPHAQITAIDINKSALQIAQSNAEDLNADIHFQQLDFLDMREWEQLGLYDVIVSNPPYIPVMEKEEMDSHVKDYEPAVGLFVPDEDPLIFYRKIAMFAVLHLKRNGAVYCETHRDYATASLELFEEVNFRQLDMRKDMHGNERMIRAAY